LTWGDASCVALVAALDSGDLDALEPGALAAPWSSIATLAQRAEPGTYTGALDFARRIDPDWCQRADVGGPEWIADRFTSAQEAINGSPASDYMARARAAGERLKWAASAEHFLAPIEPERRDASIGADRPPAGPSLVTSWSDFDALATAGMRFRVAGIWPADGLGFIAAPPKHGKTWLALALAISVATGRPFLGQHAVEQCPVVYVALEGSPGGLRARIGAIARGMGVNPDSDELRRALHLAYKPRGLNLSDPAWAQRLTTDVEAHQAGLVIVDVLRRAATIRESGDGVGDFAGLLRNLEPLQDHGRSLVFCHHFRKDGKNDDEVATGQRMAGTGSLHGHYDAALYITSYQQHDRQMRVEVDGRDFTPPRPFRVAIQGATSGPYGYVYEDAAELTITGAPTRKLTKATPEEIRGFIAAAGGELSSGPILAHFDITERTLRNRRDDLAEIGVEHVGEGRDARYIIVPEARE